MHTFADRPDEHRFATIAQQVPAVGNIQRSAKGIAVQVVECLPVRRRFSEQVLLLTGGAPGINRPDATRSRGQRC
jgi:hypothetical protein